MLEMLGQRMTGNLGFVRDQNGLHRLVRQRLEKTTSSRSVGLCRVTALPVRLVDVDQGWRIDDGVLADESLTCEVIQEGRFEPRVTVRTQPPRTPTIYGKNDRTLARFRHPSPMPGPELSQVELGRQV